MCSLSATLAFLDVLEKQMTPAEPDSQHNSSSRCCVWKFPFFACSSEKKKSKEPSSWEISTMENFNIFFSSKLCRFLDIIFFFFLVISFFNNNL